jgi:V8-like Glu-specific endopeptidase
MIGPNHALTAAHNIYSKGKKIQKVEFYPGLKQKNLCFEKVEVARVILVNEKF